MRIIFLMYNNLNANFLLLLYWFTASVSKLYILVDILLS